MESLNPKDHQEIINRAYDRWQQSEWSKEEFWEQLDPEETFAVHTGKMNQQVENGGFLQWRDNEYGTDEVIDYLIMVLQRMNTDSANQVIELLHQFEEAIELSGGREDLSGNLDSLNNAYYAISERFMADVQQALNNGTWRNPYTERTKDGGKYMIDKLLKEIDTLGSDNLETVIRYAFELLMDKVNDSTSLTATQALIDDLADHFTMAVDDN